MYGAAALATLGSFLSAIFVNEGPYRAAAPRFTWTAVGPVLRQRAIVLANVGYLGHMWELYAMWAWIPVFLLASFQMVGVRPVWASVAAFAVIGAGGIGSLIAGPIADRWGRTTLTIASMAISGVCALGVGLLFGGRPLWLVAVCLVWGFAVVADSAQFSACVSELCPSAYIGTALTLQTSLGFLLTMVTIRAIPSLAQRFGWQVAFAFLSIGPAVGVRAMLALRRSPAALRLAGGKR